MIGKLSGREEVNAALVFALSDTLVVLAAKGDGPPSPGRAPTPSRRAAA